MNVSPENYATEQLKSYFRKKGKVVYTDVPHSLKLGKVKFYSH